jgi:hypothetical protein
MSEISQEMKKELDEFEKRRSDELKKLLSCQEKMGINSCMKCEKIIGCEVRKSYVIAVYESMNKGQGGGFEF